MLYPRKIQEKIAKWLEKDEIIVLNGPRQVGKTSLLKLLQDELKQKNIPPERIFYLNLEKMDVLNDLNQNPENILKYITDKTQKNYFFLDELQYLDNPSNFLKHIYDEYRSLVKIVTTGSSALEMKAKLQDSLAGRKIVFTIEPLCFEEFLQFKQTNILNYNDQENPPAEIQNKFKNYLDEYLLFGGLPKVVLTNGNEEKKMLLQNYFDDYINKDIRYIGKIDSVLKFNQIVKMLAGQIGGMLNINTLANDTNAPRKEVENYLDLLEHTFVLHKVTPYQNNIRSQITKMPKFYFFDTGVRNQILNNFAELDSRTDSGGLFENFLYLELQQNLNKEDIHFYRTIHKTEVDFVFEKNGVVYPIEVKYKNFNAPKNGKTLLSFCNADSIVDKCPVAYLANLNLNQQSGKIKFLTFNSLSQQIFNKKNEG